MPQVPPESINDYDWEAAHHALVLYFSHRSEMNAADLAQDTLARVLKWLRDDGGKIQGEDGFMKVIYGFARNVRLESNKAARHVAEGLDYNSPAPSNTTLGLNTLDASHLLEEMLQRLSDHDRKVLLLNEEMPTPKLAKEMGVSSATARVWVHRAREKLRKLMLRENLY